ncbi:MAG: hypothetical protein OXU20_37635 [Myxococcales bacterium]|nr:hypothetical protein [Myxococcales bacterium]
MQAGDSSLTFHPLPEPTLADVHAVAERIAQRIERVLHKAGRFLDHDSQSGDSTDHDDFAEEQPVLASCSRVKFVIQHDNVRGPECAVESKDKRRRRRSE